MATLSPSRCYRSLKSTTTAAEQVSEIDCSSPHTQEEIGHFLYCPSCSAQSLFLVCLVIDLLEVNMSDHGVNSSPSLSDDGITCSPEHEVVLQHEVDEYCYVETISETISGIKK